MRRRRAFTLVEALVAVAIALPLTWGVWSAISNARRSESSAVAMGTALRGTLILERWLRRDLSRLSQTAGTDACSITAINADCSTLVLETRRPGGAASTTCETVRYELRPYGGSSAPPAYSVVRNGRPLANVVVRRFLPVVQSSPSFAAQLDAGHFCRWVCVEVETLDPGLTRSHGGELYSHATTLLAPVGWTPSSSSLVDYSDPPPETQPVHGWVERMDYNFALIGGWNPDNAGTNPSFVAQVDGKVYPLQYVATGNHDETGTGRTYTKLKFKYYQSLRMLLGQNYRSKTVDFALGAVDPETKATSWFYGHPDFRPYPFSSLSDDEVAMSHRRYEFHDDVPGLTVFFTSSKPGRCSYRLSYPTTSGTCQASAWSIGTGTYFAFLPGFEENGDVRSIVVARNWIN